MPVTPPEVVRRLKADSVRSEMEERRRDSQRVIALPKAINCCERSATKVVGDISSILNQILDIGGKVPRGGALALVPGISPLIRVLTPAQYAAWIKGIAVLEGTLVLGAVVLLSYAELAPLIEAKAHYETLSLIGSAIGAYSRTRFKDVFGCRRCMRDNALSQTHRRHRERTKILRRL